ncbi:putative isocitrate dehydrogenase [NAD] subunit alpha, mitochondrial-like Protein [Tribolium castaneum]|uniref:Putative isocitrate dehydrogenase [NAD] subunit alpha, mitochondrial-like Protein n=1 Tax=Tribolium castaneum TaxID=7070 RepID=D6WCY5_TRICA|nr:PREDICTED: isocitrate dehydrogenase [NAD] subunit gamma, mitochondrial [Tribolium castaneum]EEZ99075.1 putative isocitrate dehydrogenase [NAD] subunit alpha, mitochondrial-like Protein [Tribolium castaneum]|eukprot:XP_969166.1 PREDICTED: isocitrate dehydrogenase [NAD] subunit gamma, mitochondrial [Tribolium castaneum]
MNPSTVFKLLKPQNWLWKSVTRSKTISDFEKQHKTPKCVKPTPIPLALYGGKHTVTMIPGSGIGPELMEFVRQVFTVAKAPVHFETVTIDENREDNTDLEYAIISIKRNGVAIKGNVDTFSADTTVRLSNVAIRNELDLCVYLMRCKSYPGVRAKHENVDIVVVRQNTEGEYCMLEHSIRNGTVVENLKIITEENSQRVAKYAFDYARKNGRKKVTTVHKANIMKFSDGLFLQTARKVAKDYPDIQHNDIIVDNCCMQLVTRPQQFEVLLTPNLYGNIVANVICGLIGGPGLVSGRNYGAHYAVFEPGTRNSGRTIANKNIANPVAMLNASVDMLYHLGYVQHAKVIENAIFQAVAKDKVHTPDLGGSASSVDVVKKILEYI